MDKREALLQIVKDHALTLHPEGGLFTFASGAKSPAYLDMRRVNLHAQGGPLAAELLNQLAERQRIEFDVAGGMESGAIPMSALFCAASGKTNGFYVRKKPKGHGRGQQIEGHFAPGNKVLMLEDTVSTGGSLLQAVEIMRAAGGVVEHALCIADWGLGSTAMLAEHGVTLHSLFTPADLGIDADRITPADAA